MRKLALAIGMAMAVASTPALAEEVLFIVENTLDYTIHATCGPVEAIHAGQESEIIPCYHGTIHVMYNDFISDIAILNTHNCEDPTPVHRIKAIGATPALLEEGGHVDQTYVLTVSQSCESDPRL